MRSAPQLRSLAAVCGHAIGVAIAGSTLLGAFECALAAWAVSRDLIGERLPLFLIVSVIGKNAATHLIVWAPMMLAAAVVLRWLPATRSLARALLAPLFVLVAGGATLSLDLAIAHRESLVYTGGAWGVAAIGAAALYFVGRWLARQSPVRAGRMRRWTTGVGIAAFVVAAAPLLSSPLVNPGSWASSNRPASGLIQLPATRNFARPNVLWIVLDTTRADRMSLYGYERPTTPFLADFAEESLVCDRAIANGMWTVPSHAAMFTGMSAREHGTGHRNLHLDDAFVTVAEELRRQGYETAAFSNNPLVSPRTNLLQGFDEWRILYHHRQLQQFSLSYLCERMGWTPPLPWLDGDYGAALTNSMIEAWLNVYRTQPHFVFVNYMEAHLPYRVPRRYREMFMTPQQVARSYELRRKAFGNCVHRLDRDFNITGGDFVSESDREVLRRQYDAAIRYLDDRVRELIGMYESRGLLHNTLVVIAGDHGEYLGAHGMWGHRFLAYQDLAHVPLLVRYPRGLAARRIATPTQVSDLYATVLNEVLPNAPDHTRAASVNLSAIPPASATTQPTDRIAICECNGPAPVTMKSFAGITDPVVLHRTSPQIAAVGGRYKLMLSADGQRELYDLLRDPGELRNLYGELPDVAAEFERFVANWLARTPMYEPPAGLRETPSDDMLKTLRALGYVGGDDEP